LAKQTEAGDVLGSYSKYSTWVLIIGLLVAISAAFTKIPYAGLILAAIGTVIGLLNLNKDLLKPALALLVLGLLDFSKVELIGSFAEPILNSAALLAAPIALLIGLKKLYSSLK
jgi:hypothetical protein